MNPVEEVVNRVGWRFHRHHQSPGKVMGTLLFVQPCNGRQVLADPVDQAVVRVTERAIHIKQQALHARNIKMPG